MAVTSFSGKGSMMEVDGDRLGTTNFQHPSSPICYLLMLMIPFFFTSILKDIADETIPKTSTTRNVSTNNSVLTCKVK